MIKLTPAGAITATSYPLTYEITEMLKSPFCEGHEPVVTISWAVNNIEVSGAQVFGTAMAVVTVAAPGKTPQTFVEKFPVSGTGTSFSIEGENAIVSGFSPNGCCKMQGISAIGTVTVSITG